MQHEATIFIVWILIKVINPLGVEAAGPHQVLAGAGGEGFSQAALVIAGVDPFTIGIN